MTTALLIRGFWIKHEAKIRQPDVVFNVTRQEARQAISILNTIYNSQNLEDLPSCDRTSYGPQIECDWFLDGMYVSEPRCIFFKGKLGV